jgi:hypothetical protein
MAVAKYRTQGPQAWEAYINGAFRRFEGNGLGNRMRSRLKFADLGGAIATASSGGGSVTARARGWHGPQRVARGVLEVR